MLTVGSIGIVPVRDLSTESLPLQWARCFNMMPRLGNITVHLSQVARGWAPPTDNGAL